MRSVTFIFTILLYTAAAIAQPVSVGTNTPHASAQLDVSSTSKGFLLPRMTKAERNAILHPAAGLMIWCTDCDEMQAFDGTTWKNANGAAGNDALMPYVKICGQTWSLKNLSVRNYANGDSIPQVTDPSVWSGLTTGAWCWYNNDSATYAAVYGRLYNWYAVNDPRGLAPAGWHIPTRPEYETLVGCLGGVDIAGGAMKEGGIVHWAEPNTGDGNSSGFTAVPGGYRNESGDYFLGGNGGTEGDFWTVTDADANNAQELYLGNNYVYVGLDPWGKKAGFSIRCVKD